MDKLLRSTIIAGIIIIVPSIVYFAVYLPYKKQLELKKCLETSENNLSTLEKMLNKKLEENIEKNDSISINIIESLDKAEKEKIDEDDRCYQRYK